LLLIALKLPILKTLILNMNLRSFCFVFGSLIESGITVSQSLYLTSLVISHPELKEAALRMYQKIQGGANFEEVLVQERIFPPVFSGVMIIGSETGNLSKVLEVMEKYYEDEVKYSIKNLMTLLEPLLIVFVGIIVGLIAISIVVPVYQQISAQLEQGLQQRQMP
jgi:type IV pilus assembly protein PilC